MPRLSADEVEALISGSALVRIATVDADGAPLVVPVGYLYRDRQILMTARERVSWLANIRRDPRVCLSIDRERYPLSKVTIRGNAQVLYEPGRDDEWRDARLPVLEGASAGPSAIGPDGREEWRYDAAYHAMTHDEPRALVAVPLDGSRVTSWRMPVEGEYLDGSWASSYYRGTPRRFKVVRAGRSLGDVFAVPE
jgi:hypothetical protein